MSTLIRALSTAVLNSLTKSLPAAAAAKFNVPEAEFAAFLGEFLKEQLKAGKKGVRAGADKKHGRVSGYNLFSKELRRTGENKGIDFKVSGAKWQALSAAEKAEWNRKAADANAAAPQPAAAAQQPAPAQVPEEPSSGSETEAESAAPAKKKGRAPAATKPGEIKVSMDKSTKKWMVPGTMFVAAGPKNKVIIGKMVNGEQQPLDEADRALCQKNQWPIGEEDTNKKEKKASRSKKQVIARPVLAAAAESDDE